MNVTPEKNEKVANMVFASIYPLYLNRLEKNGKTKEELNQVIEWFTGFDQKAIQTLIDEKVTLELFLKKQKYIPTPSWSKESFVVIALRKLQKNLNCTNNAGKWKSWLMNWQKVVKWKKFYVKKRSSNATMNLNF